MQKYSVCRQIMSFMHIKSPVLEKQAQLLQHPVPAAGKRPPVLFFHPGKLSHRHFLTDHPDSQTVSPSFHPS